MSAIERTGWRDSRLSEKHRLWGACYAVDIDFTLAEYDFNGNILKVCAIIEYKEKRAPIQDPKHHNLRALKTLADKAELPFFAVRYDLDITGEQYHIVPLNNLAKTDYKRVTVNESGYVEFLHDLRNKSVPLDMKERLEWLDEYDRAWEVNDSVRR